MFTFVNHSLHRQKVSLCRSLCKITISIVNSSPFFVHIR
nr:MAG TPA: hypothetical protein [Caudoviricetes sp.]